jgi:ATP-dependent DNA helicase RecG
MMTKSDSGLELAEFDLKLRGPGEVYGERQSGLPSLKIARLNDLELIRKAKDYALRLDEIGVKKIELFS